MSASTVVDCLYIKSVDSDTPPVRLDFASGGDAVPGGYNGYLVAYGAAGKKLGYLDYQLVTDARWDDGRVEIAMIEVIEQERRQGVGLLLLERLQQEFPDRQFDWGYLTPEGQGLREKWESLHPLALID